MRVLESVWKRGGLALKAQVRGLSLAENHALPVARLLANHLTALSLSFSCYKEKKVRLTFPAFLAWLEGALKYENYIISCKALLSCK